MHDDDEEVVGEDGLRISDSDGDMDELEGINDFGLDEEDPDKDK